MAVEDMLRKVRLVRCNWQLQNPTIAKSNIPMGW